MIPRVLLSPAVEWPVGGGSEHFFVSENYLLPEVYLLVPVEEYSLLDVSIFLMKHQFMNELKITSGFYCSVYNFIVE